MEKFKFTQEKIMEFSIAGEKKNKVIFCQLSMERKYKWAPDSCQAENLGSDSLETHFFLSRFKKKKKTKPQAWVVFSSTSDPTGNTFGKKKVLLMEKNFQLSDLF